MFTFLESGHFMYRDRDKEVIRCPLDKFRFIPEAAASLVLIAFCSEFDKTRRFLLEG